MLAQDSGDLDLAATYFNQAQLAGRNQKLWNANLYGPMIFVEPSSRTVYANMADNAGILKPYKSIFTGTLPKDVMIANTAITWQGKKWSVILWPLPNKTEDRLALMLHESFHRIQNQLELTGNSPTADHLSTLKGRIYFLLELQALKIAINKPIYSRSVDLQNALVFRKQRQQLFPATFANEQVLEVSEGLAEFTGMILGRKKENIPTHLKNQIDTAANRKSLIRSSAYLTGAIYGYLLYQKNPNWTKLVNSNTNFPSLISKIYGIQIPAKVDSSALAKAEKLYNAQQLIRSETEKEEQRLAIAKSYTELFTKKTLLKIKLIKMGIQFNPNNLLDLGELGTLYPTAEVKDSWGTLTVKEQGMLLKDWQVLYLSMENFSQSDRIIKGNGWEIVLNQGWRMAKINELQYQLEKL